MMKIQHKWNYNFLLLVGVKSQTKANTSTQVHRSIAGDFSLLSPFASDISQILGDSSKHVRNLAKQKHNSKSHTEELNPATSPPKRLCMSTRSICQRHLAFVSVNCPCVRRPGTSGDYRLSTVRFPAKSARNLTCTEA